MTKLVKSGLSHRGFRFFQIAALAALIFQLQSIGQAQGNNVDLYSWMDNSTPFQGLIDIGSSNSANFIGSYNFEGGFNELVLLGSLNTTPGTTYEISFSLQDESPTGDDAGSGSFNFGNSETGLDGVFSDSYLTNGMYVFPTVNYTFDAVATSSTTAMSFDFALDEGLDTSLSNFAIGQITPMPEMSSVRLFFYGGCVLLSARKFRQSFKKRKLAIKRIA